MKNKCEDPGSAVLSPNSADYVQVSAVLIVNLAGFFAVSAQLTGYGEIRTRQTNVKIGPMPKNHHKD